MSQRSNRLILIITGVIALPLVVATAAMAARLVGDDGPNTLTGTPFADRILAKGGDDTVSALAGRDLVHAGAGNDTVSAGANADGVRGSAGDDALNGESGTDALLGGDGNDTVDGGSGRDKSDGGDGQDVLWALARVDVAAIGDPEGDELTGGPGRDRIMVRDGEADIVHCGEDRDLVVTDQFDQLDPDCEVRRQSDITSLDQVDDREENQTENPAEDRDEG